MSRDDVWVDNDILDMEAIAERCESSGELRLAAAMVISAVQDFMTAKPGSANWKSARKYLFSAGSASFWSFENMAQLFGFDAQQARDRLVKRAEYRRLAA